ncbi:inositol 1,4,5-trisphosphate receptor-interacting protein, partial [Spinachia spinachia]
MPDTLLRVIFLALGLLTYPRDNKSGVEELEEITTNGLQKHEERLWLGGEKLDHQMAPVNGEMTHTDKRRPRDDTGNVQSDQHGVGKETMTALKSVTISLQDSEGEVVDHNSSQREHKNSDASRPQISKSDLEATLKTSQMECELNGNVQVVKNRKQGEDRQSGGSFADPSQPQGQQNDPEEKEMLGPKEQESAPSHRHAMTPENEASEDAAEREGVYLWYMWNTLSILSMVRFFRKYLGKPSQMKQVETKAFPAICTTAEVLLPDHDTLQKFHSKCFEGSSDKKLKEFLEGFMKDLFAAMRAVCHNKGGMVIEDFQIVDACDIIVPINPPHPYSFQCRLWNSEPSDLLPDMQVYGQIKLVENEKIQNGCHCQSPDSEDMVCLLHSENESMRTKSTNIRDVLLCTNNSPFLSK